jgi:hypothetical protein
MRGHIRMGYLAAAVFGLSIGTLIAYATIPTTRWLPYLSVGVILIIAVGQLWRDPTGAPYGIVIALASSVSSALVAGVVWRDHPLLTGSGYWGRVWIATAHWSLLRRSFAEQAK